MTIRDIVDSLTHGYYRHIAQNVNDVLGEKKRLGCEYFHIISLEKWLQDEIIKQFFDKRDIGENIHIAYANHNISISVVTLTSKAYSKYKSNYMIAMLWELNEK